MKQRMIKEKKYIERVLFTLLPVISVCLVLIFAGKSINKVYLPNGDWNDEMIYYQMVNSHMASDSTYGFFGYNESTAEIGNFGAWSPARIILWYAFGKLFGWSYNSQWIANLFFMSLAFFVFTLMVDITKKTVVKMLLFFCTYYWFTKSILSGMSEATGYVFLIIFLGLTIRWYVYDKINEKEILIGYLLVTLLFVLRPYFAFLLVFIWDVSRKKIGKNKVVITTFITIVLYPVLYIIFNKYMTAQLWTGNLVETHWLDSFKNDGFLAGIINLLSVAIEMFKTLFLMCKNAILRDPLNITCGMALATILVFVSSIILMTRRNVQKYKKLILLWDVFFVVLMFASFYLFDIVYAVRHWACYVIIMGMIISILDNRMSGMIVCINAIIFIYLFAGIANGTNGGIPIYTAEKELEINKFSSAMISQVNGKDPWDYTIDWVVSDFQDGAEEYTDYTLLFGAPKGYAISVCKASFIIDEFDTIKSKYVYTLKDGDVSIFLQNSNAEKVYTNDKIVLYKIR